MKRYLIVPRDGPVCRVHDVRLWAAAHNITIKGVVETGRRQGEPLLQGFVGPRWCNGVLRYDQLQEEQHAPRFGDAV
jgi:hypothetical protein